MPVQCYENVSKDVKKIIKIDTENTSYVIGVIDDEQFLGHIYYGAYLMIIILRMLCAFRKIPLFHPKIMGKDFLFWIPFLWNILRMA